MKSTTVLLSALALLAAVPAIAQESKTKTTTRRQERTVIIQRNGDNPQIQTNDSTMIIEQIDGDDLSDINIDSLRNAIGEQGIEAKQLKIEVKRLNKDLKKQLRELQRTKIIIKDDTTGLARELEMAQKSIEDANGQILGLDANLHNIDLGKNGRFSVSITTDTTSDGGTKRMVIMMNDSGLHICNSKLARLGKMGTMSSVIIRRGSDSAQNGDATLALQELGANGDVMMNLSNMPSMTFGDGKNQMNVGNGMVMMGNDTTMVLNGKDGQTTVRIGHDTTHNGVHSSLVIVTQSHKTSLPTSPDTIQGPTMDVSSPATQQLSASGYQLDANRPNPFSSQTVISFTLPKPGHTTLTVFNTDGKEVRVLKDEEMQAGTYSVTFDASDLPSGNYLYRLVSGGFTESKTMSLTK